MADVRGHVTGHGLGKGGYTEPLLPTAARPWRAAQGVATGQRTWAWLPDCDPAPAVCLLPSAAPSLPGSRLLGAFPALLLSLIGKCIVFYTNI